MPLAGRDRPETPHKIQPQKCKEDTTTSDAWLATSRHLPPSRTLQSIHILPLYDPSNLYAETSGTHTATLRPLKSVRRNIRNTWRRNPVKFTIPDKLWSLTPMVLGQVIARSTEHGQDIMSLLIRTIVRPVWRSCGVISSSSVTSVKTHRCTPAMYGQLVGHSGRDRSIHGIGPIELRIPRQGPLSRLTGQALSPYRGRSQKLGQHLTPATAPSPRLPKQGHPPALPGKPSRLTGEGPPWEP